MEYSGFKIHFILVLALLVNAGSISAQTDIYGELKKELDGGYYPTISKKLGFVFEEKYTSGNLNYSIYDAQRTVLLSSNPGGNNQLDKPKVLGENFIQFDFNSNNYGLVLNEYYILEVVDEKGQKQYMRFRYLSF